MYIIKFLSLRKMKNTFFPFDNNDVISALTIGLRKPITKGEVSIKYDK